VDPDLPFSPDELSRRKLAHIHGTEFLNRRCSDTWGKQGFSNLNKKMSVECDKTSAFLPGKRIKGKKGLVLAELFRVSVRRNDRYTAPPQKLFSMQGYDKGNRAFRSSLRCQFLYVALFQP
jgi:hypothetical protein